MRLLDRMRGLHRPEYQVLPTLEERRIVATEVNRRFAWSRHNLLYVGVFGLVAPFLGQFVFRTGILGVAFPWLPSSMRFLAAFLLIAIPIALGYYLLFARKRERRLLRAYLNEIDYPICMKCGYDLRGQTEPRCPECGEPYTTEIVDDASTRP